MDQQYEIIFICEKKDEIFKANLATIKDLLKKLKASIDSEEDMGVRNLAYDINKKTEGHYYLILFTTAPASVIEIEKQLKINESILRYMIVKKA